MQPSSRTLPQASPDVREKLAACRLYAIVDRAVLGNADPARAAELLVEGGADMIQYRDKAGSDREVEAAVLGIREACAGRVPLIVNDRAALALRAGADGVHLGPCDLPVKEARALCGPGFLLGATARSEQAAGLAAADGADYLGMGAVFATHTKADTRPLAPEVVARASARLSVPVFAIGGIGPENLSPLLGLGIRRVCVCAALLRAPDVRAATRSLKNLLGGAPA